MSSKRKNKKPKLDYTLHLSSKYSNINFLEPMHGRAYETVKAKIAGETTWVESKTGGLPLLFVEERYVRGLVEHIRSDGYTVAAIR